MVKQSNEELKMAAIILIKRKTLLSIFIILLQNFLFTVQAQKFIKPANEASARQTILFNNNWKFYKGDIAGADKISFNDSDWRLLDLPHDWSIEGPFDEQWASATAYLPTGIGWYRKTFDVTPAMHSKNIAIYFDGVYNNSEVWINGHYLGKRPSGFIPFEYDLTKYLNNTGKNIITVKADHTQFADSRWYTGSGIYRNVYLIATNPVSIDLWGVGFTTPQVTAQKATANVAVTLTNKSASASDVIVKSRLTDAHGKPVAEGQQTLPKIKAGAKASSNISFNITGPDLWSIENPALYTLATEVYVQGKKTDDIVQQVGIRSFKFDKDKGFLLNGKNLKIKGVCIHDDAGALGVAVPEEVWERRLQTLKEGGCNSLRLSHNPHADYLYNLCDKMGFLVMDEAFDEWESGKNKWIKGWNVGKPGQDGYHEYFKEWANRDLGDMVRCNRNHPSIILWSIGNEIDYPNDPYTHPILNSGRNPQIYGKGYTAGHPSAARLTELAKQLVAVVKAIDTTRPVTAALAGVVMSNEVGFPEVLDIVGYNYQEFRYSDDHTKYPNRIIYGSENGMALTAWNAVADNDYISAQYLWTGIDYLGEARQWPARSSQAGLIDLAGYKKPQYYFRQSLWSDKPMIYIGTSAIRRDTGNNANRFARIAAPSWNYTGGDSVKVSCYTNCTTAELFLNGTSLGKKSMADAQERTITWNTVFAPGELVVKGYNNDKEVSSYTIKTAGEPYAIKAKADRTSFAQSKKELAHIEMDIVDKNGIAVYAAENEITVNIEGPATLLGLESASLTSHEDYKANKRKALHGKLLAYIQSTQKTGPVKVTISAAGLQAQVVQFSAQ